MTDTPVTFSCGDLRLEGRLLLPAAGASARRAPGVVVCHPHPLYGGDMESSVVRGMAEALCGMGLAALRFNFRGVGRSGGRHGEGEAELADVAAALETLAGRSEVDPARLGVAGYSFGAWVGLRAGCLEPRVLALAAVAPPIALLPPSGLAPCPKPVLALSGTRDDFCPLSAFEPWADSLARGSERVILQGGDHFFLGREGEVGTAVARFFGQRLG